jgi:hypothetical protein
MNAHSAFIGDRFYSLRLTRKEIPQLEEHAGTGIGTIWRRLLSGVFTQADLNETIRLGLIGAGASPQSAATIVERHVVTRPFAETLPIAIGVLEILFVGAPASPHKDVAA